MDPYDQDFDRYQERRAEIYVEPLDAIRMLRNLVASRMQGDEQDWTLWEAEMAALNSQAIAYMEGEDR